MTEGLRFDLNVANLHRVQATVIERLCGMQYTTKNLHRLRIRLKKAIRRAPALTVDDGRWSGFVRISWNWPAGASLPPLHAVTSAEARTGALSGPLSSARRERKAS
jgi:hypothetical protein